MRNYDISNLQFLVVDDNPNMRKLVVQILRSLNANKVKEADDGADALKVMKVWLPDIAIIDWEMSPLDGLELTRMIRRNDDSPNPFLPIIMLSAHTEMVRITEARDAGIHEFLAKPVSAKTLYSRIASIIEKPRDFIRAPGYVGPDRKRRDDTHYSGEERRMSSEAFTELSLAPGRDDDDED
ncbi:MAG: response regulator [Magnetovibrionaceae bacterium]